MSPRGFVRRCSGELNGAIAELVERHAEQRSLLLDDADDLYGMPPIRSSRPIGFEPGKKYFATSSPMTTTGEPSSTSCGEKTRPAVEVVFLIVK